MLDVKIPSEIRAYKSKLLFGLTARQLISIAGAFAAGATIAVLGSKVIPIDYVMWVIIIVAGLIVAWGFATYKGMRFEEFVRVMVQFNINPQRRVYEDWGENYFCFIKMVLNARDIRQQIIDSGQYDKDEFMDLETEEKDYVFKYSQN
jgi:hypothetical protein